MLSGPKVSKSSLIVAVAPLPDIVLIKKTGRISFLIPIILRSGAKRSHKADKAPLEENIFTHTTRTIRAGRIFTVVESPILQPVINAEKRSFFEKKIKMLIKTIVAGRTNDKI